MAARGLGTKWPSKLRCGLPRPLSKSKSSGDVGYGTGTYVITGADGSHLDHGKWMLASKKVDGKWVTQCDIFNSDMPTPSGAMK